MKDPQFHRDIGFYVFKLPFLEFIAGWTFAALLVILIVTLVFHYLNGGIRLQTPFQRVTPQVKVHISVILALMALTKTVQYYLSRFGLTFSHRGVVDGATYTDVHAQLPALNLLMFISVAAAILFILNIFRRGWVFPIIAVGLWGFISIVVGTIYPAIIQRFVVQPNEFPREQTYIKRNIDSTRTAFDLDTIQTKKFNYNGNLTSEGRQRARQPADARRTLGCGIRARCRRCSSRPKNSSPSIRSPTSTSTATTSTASPRDAERCARARIRRSSRATRGPTVTSCTRTGTAWTPPPRTRTPATNPAISRQDIPAQGSICSSRSPTCISVKASAVTRWSTARSPSRRPTARPAPRPRSTRAAAASRSAGSRAGSRSPCGSATSTSCTRARSPRSRAFCICRDIQERVQTAAPFLQWDADPYAVNLNGKIVWVLDGYTTTNQYPYSQSIDPTVPNSSGLNTNLNYVRNSVKATVDAYNGTIRFYVVDPSDPIIRTYEKAFPDLFEQAIDMPPGCRRTCAIPKTSSTRRPSSTRCTT